MASKKPSSKKSVIDYDPLAWLNEEPGVESDAENEVTQPAAQMLQSKKVDIEHQASDPVAEKINMTEIDSLEENPAWGIFVDDDTTDTAASKNELQDAEPAAFGFFDTASGQADGSAQSDECIDKNMIESDDENKGWGLFETDSMAASTAAVMDNENNVINLGTDLTIRSVAASKALIDQCISNGFDVRLAAGDIQKIDSAGLQLIYSLKMTLEKSVQSIHWVSSNAVINDAAKLLGLPKLCEVDTDADPGYGFFVDDTDSSSDAENGYGFF